MSLRQSLTRRNVIIASLILIVVAGAGCFFLLRRPPRTDMQRFVPAEALAFLEVDSVTDLAEGLTDTTAWRELGPVLGLSSQLRQVGFVTDLMGRTGLGPQEGVLLGRSQYLLVLTSVSAETGETEEGPHLHLKPKLTLLIDSHLEANAAARMARDRAPLIAQRIFGDEVAAIKQPYGESELQVFNGPGVDHQLIAASAGSVVLLSNETESIESCLDTITGRSSSISGDQTLNEARKESETDSAAFAFVTARGIRRLLEISPVLLKGDAGGSENVNAFAELLQHLSEQTLSGLTYSLEFSAGGVTEKYFAILKPDVGETLAEQMQPTSSSSKQLIEAVPKSIEQVTLIDSKDIGDLPQHLLKSLVPHVDVVAGVALREFVLNFRKEFGLEPTDSLSNSIGDEIAVINFGDDNARAMVMQVNDRSKVSGLLGQYLRVKSAQPRTESISGNELMISGVDEKAAAAFVGDNLVLGTRDQIEKVIEAQTGSSGIAGEQRFARALANRTAGASVVSYQTNVDSAARLLLAISKLTRVTDGSFELLDREAASKAIDRFPRSVSYTEFRKRGIYIESHSAVGSFGLLGGLMKKGDE